MKEVNPRPGLDKAAIYKITVPGQLDKGWSDWFGGMAIAVKKTNDGHTITTLTGVVTDQAALQGLLERIYVLGLPLLSVECLERDFN